MFSGAATAGRCRWFWDSWATVCCVPSARVAYLQQDSLAVGAVQSGESERRKKCRIWRLKMSPDGSEACQSFAGITESFEFEASPFHETEKQAAHAAIGSV